MAPSLDKYQPAASFKQIDRCPPLLEDAASDSTELWIVQLPVNELGPKDLMDQQWSMHSADPDNKLGHFYSARGDVYDVVKENMESRRLFAILPDTTDYSGIRSFTSSFLISFLPESLFSSIIAHKWSLNEGPEFGLWNLRVLSCNLVYCLKFAWWDPGAVRRITSKICLRRHIELQKVVSVSGHAKSEVTTPRADSTKSQHKRALTDVRQASTATEASVGNMEGVELETKKKKKKKSKAEGLS